MTKHVTITPATEQHRAYVVSIIIARWSLSEKEANEEFNRWLANDLDSICYVAIYNGNPMGTGVFDTYREVQSFDISPYNTLLWVEPFFRGLGVGYELTKERFKWAESKGYKEVYLDTQKAVEYHLKRGWQVVRKLTYQGEEYTIMKIVIGNTVEVAEKPTNDTGGNEKIFITHYIPDENPASGYIKLAIYTTTPASKEAGRFYYGYGPRDISEAEMTAKIDEGTVKKLRRPEPVKKGDTLWLDSDGTVWIANAKNPLKEKEGFLKFSGRVVVGTDKEKILCAAIWYKDIELKRVFEHNVLPLNCDKGLVFCGHRHPHCMYSMVSVTGLSAGDKGDYVEGFLTSKNRFVDREEAAIIHVANGGKLNYNYNRLFSEDLY